MAWSSITFHPFSFSRLVFPLSLIVLRKLKQKKKDNSADTYVVWKRRVGRPTTCSNNATISNAQIQVGLSDTLCSHFQFLKLYLFDYSPVDHTPFLQFHRVSPDFFHNHFHNNNCSLTHVTFISEPKMVDETDVKQALNGHDRPLSITLAIALLKVGKRLGDHKNTLFFVSGCVLYLRCCHLHSIQNICGPSRKTWVIWEG